VQLEQDAEPALICDVPGEHATQDIDPDERE
jgi:hypothetical protein